MTDGFSFGAIFARLGEVVDPDAEALIHDDRTTSWGEFDRRTDALAATFLGAGAEPGDKVAHLMRNGPAYLETTIASFKSRLVHVNVNYRYTGPELHYILDNSDAAVVVFDAEFADLVASLDLPKVRLFLQVGGKPAAPFRSFEAATTSGAALPPQDHRPDDMMFIYTGGTTGMPKGVMWDQSAIWALSGGGGSAVHGIAPTATLDALFANVRGGVGVLRSLIMPPLMHGTGFLTAIYTLARGGSVVTLTAPGFVAVEALEACARHAPDYATIVGDAFARPLLRALDAGGGSIASIGVMISSGTMWSPEVKAGLIAHNQSLITIDAFSSSESIGMGAAVRTATDAGTPTRFMIDENTVVLDEDMRPVLPGSGTMGRVARSGLIPRGYYKDEAKSAATFVQVGDRRFSIAGDWATVDADGSIVLLGRLSHCINTGGEKVFPEEVEEALKTHASVEDALVFGTPDEKWGQAVTAVVEGHDVDTAALTAHVRGCLAAYKAPKRIVVVRKVPRAPNGKADYARAKEMAG
ncbi:AMP-binding protein [Sphingosinicellaceae bacterium]|nr:AMP-binding protein [Sphingosinicellaceae bacterium]